MAAYSYSFRDYSDERSSVEIRVEEPSEIGADWETIINANEANVRAALQGVSLANIASHHVRVSEEAPNDTRPASAFAQRELGLRVFYQDDTNAKKSFITVPAPDMANLTLVEGSDQVTLADGGIMAALVSALESYMYSPDGNAITVTSARVVGRNS